MIPSAIVIPIRLLGSMLEPAALFAAWGVVVVGVLGALSAALGRDRLPDGPPPRAGNEQRAAA